MHKSLLVYQKDKNLKRDQKMKIANSTEIDPIFQNLMDYYAERNLMLAIIFGLYLTCAITWKCWVKCYAGCAQMCQNPDRTATTAQRVS